MKVTTQNLGKDNVTLTIYLHDKSKELLSAKTRPAVLIFPGGGYYNCSDREAEPIALAYLAEGYNAFVLRYTVGNATKFSEAFDDAEAAINLMHQNADDFDIDKERITVVGFSAGGHLAAMLGTTGKIRPNAMVLCYPCITTEMGKRINRELPCADKNVDDKTPPSFIFSTRDDNVVPINNSLAFANALDKENIPFELHIYGHGAHGLSLAKPLTANGLKDMNEPLAAGWFALSVAWLKTLFGDFCVEYNMPIYDIALGDIGVDTPLHVLLSNEKTLEVLNDILPDIVALSKDNEMMCQASLQIIAHHAPESIPQEKLLAVEDKLKKIMECIKND